MQVPAKSTPSCWPRAPFVRNRLNRPSDPHWRCVRRRKSIADEQSAHPNPRVGRPQNVEKGLDSSVERRPMPMVELHRRELLLGVGGNSAKTLYHVDFS